MSEQPPPKPPSDLDAGLRFLHVLGMQTKYDVLETNVRVLALLEEMIARGQVDLRSFDQRRERIKERELERTRAQAAVTVAPAVDKYKLTVLPDIDCATNVQWCKGRCCMLSFPLSFQDLDEGVVKWEYQRPYTIKHRADGYCVHSTESRGCGVYANRPGICRSYDCRDDKRIWSDYANRVAAPWPNEINDPEAEVLHEQRMDPTLPVAPHPDGEPER